MSTSKLAEILSNHGIKPSYPRLQIYKYLQNKKNHPTVDSIYLSLVEEIPTLSKTTVYNTLKLFSEAGLVNPLNLDENEKRYELVDEDHLHFKCLKCGQIYDIKYDEINLLPSKYKNFKIQDKHILLKGICENCI